MPVSTEEKRKMLREMRVQLDANTPGWRDVPARNGEPSRFIQVTFTPDDGPEFDLMLHMKPELLTTEFGGEEFGEFEPGA